MLCYLNFKNLIERSVKFDEPLQEVELVKEKTVEFPSYSTEYLDDEIGGHDLDLDPPISNISVQKTSYYESESEVQNHLPTWARQILSSAGDNIGNPDDPRRTGLISKEQVLRFLVLIICCSKLVI